MTRARGSAGYTLVELLTTIAIIAILAVIGIETISSFNTPSMTKARQNAEKLREFLTYAQIRALGAPSSVIVVINPTGGYFYGCVPPIGNTDCTAADQAAFPIAMPDTVLNRSNQSIKGIKLTYGVAFGTSDPAQNPFRLSGAAILSSGVYYENQTGGSIIAPGVFTTGSTPNVIVFKRDGTSDAGTLDEMYLWLTKAATSFNRAANFNFAVTVDPNGRVSMYEYGDIAGTTAWKMR